MTSHPHNAADLSISPQDEPRKGLDNDKSDGEEYEDEKLLFHSLMTLDNV